MKRILSVILSLLFVCALGMPVFASGLEEYELGEALTVQTITDAVAPGSDSEDIFKIWIEEKMYAVYQNGELVGQVRSYMEDGKVKYGELEESLAVGHVIASYGTDNIIISYREDRFVLLKGSGELLYPLEQFEEKGVDKKPYRFSLSQYIKAATFLEAQPGIEDPKYRDFVSDGITAELVMVANEYWDSYFTKDDTQSNIISVCVIGGIVLFLAALITAIVLFDKKGKLKITNEIVGKFWLPALCKGVTWRLK